MDNDYIVRLTPAQFNEVWDEIDAAIEWEKNDNPRHVRILERAKERFWIADQQHKCVDEGHPLTI